MGGEFGEGKYLFTAGGFDGFAHLEHFELDDFVFGVAFAVAPSQPC